MSPIAVPRMEGGSTGEACGPLRPESGPAARHRAVLVDEAVLPGETHVINGHWDEEKAVLAGLPDGGGQLVLLPRSLVHQTATPRVGLLAVVDGVGRNEFGEERKARTFGLRRVEVVQVEREGPLLLVHVCEVEDEYDAPAATVRRLTRLSKRAASCRTFRSGEDLPPDVAHSSLGQVADWAARWLDPGPEARLALLTTVRWPDRLPILERLLRPERTPRRASRRKAQPTDGLDARLESASLPSDVRAVAERDLTQSHGSHGAGNRDAVETILDLVWAAPTPPVIEVEAARRILDASHAGLEHAKQAVLDYLVVLEWQRRHGKTGAPGPALCLVGPPGTGKTTLAQGVADAMGRRLERLGLGGVDDVFLIGAERTYNRSRPGEIVRRLRAAKVHPSQLVFLLDEIDKVSLDPYRSPVPVLLGLLDPSQNTAVQDHFLDGVRIDLSGALFLATANERTAIPAPLRDRLRFIEVPGYSQAEQLEIARTRLLPKLVRNLGITDEVEIEPAGLESLVFEHPHSAGCRQLEQRLQLVISRALGLHLAHGGPVVVDRARARQWVPPEASAGIGFRMPGDSQELS